MVTGSSYHNEADVAMHCAVTEDDILDIQVVSDEDLFLQRMSSFL